MKPKSVAQQETFFDPLHLLPPPCHSEVHITDTRNYEYYVGDKLNVFEYMEEIKPDYVIVLYTSIGHENAGRFDFD